MSNLQQYALPYQNTLDSAYIDNALPNFSQLQTITNLPISQLNYRFYCLNEISESSANQYRLAMANVISSLSINENAIIYLLSGKPDGVKFYIGVAGNHEVVNECMMLKHSFEGNFLGAHLTSVENDNIELNELFQHTQHLGLVTGVPSYNEEEANLEGKDFQGIERLVNTLTDTTWQMVIVAEPGKPEEISHSLEQIYDLSTQLSSQIKHSVQQSENNGSNFNKTTGSSESSTQGESQGDSRTETQGTNSSESHGKSSSSTSSNDTKGVNNSTSVAHNTGTNQSATKGTSESISIGNSSGQSIALTRERINKRNEQTQAHLNDTQISRFRLGRSKGMFRTAIYICAETQATYNRLACGVQSIFQGSQPSYTPLTVHKLSVVQPLQLRDLLQIRRVKNPDFLSKKMDTAIVHSIPQYDHQHIAAATWLNTRELALLAGLPCLELPGLKLRKSVSFALNTVNTQNNTPTIKLGNIVQDGRPLLGKLVEIPIDALNKHIFVTGVTGAGKTTTCMKLLLESGFPFTVIEPAKTEYRALHSQVQDIEYYALGREDLSTFRLNPFELVSKHHNLTGHISMLKATIIAAFPMEASMPFIVENAIIEAYKEKGWDIPTSKNYFEEDPWQTDKNIWPTFSDMITQLDNVIKSAGMGKEFEEKYRGSLVSRLSSLTSGIKGTMINTPRSIDFDKLLDKKVVIELEELKDEEDKAFFMGLIIGRLAECMKQRHRCQPHFHHITLVEEAHRLLSQPEPGAEGSKKMGVEMFANLLAEVRKYGECLIIADQIPNKLVSDVIKNTNTKIIHRLFAADDRHAIGDAMGLNDEQKDFLPMLQAGETVIYSGGWHAPVRAQIDQLTDTTAPEISETLIQQQGFKQLWEHRFALLPRLSCNPVLNENNFAAVFQTASAQINLLINLAQRHSKQCGSSCSAINVPDMLHKMATRLAKEVNQAQQQFAFDDQQWANIMADLLADCDTTQELNENDLMMLRTTLPTFLTQLAISSHNFFEHIRTGQSKMVFFQIFAKRQTF